MTYLMQPYDDALREILENGTVKSNQRTGIKTLSVFGMLKRYRLDTGRFPIVTKRKVWPKSVWAELLWYLEGSTSNERLKEIGCNFWTPWVDEQWEKEHGYASSSFGPVYGFNLRHFGGDYNDGVHDAGDYGAGGFDQLDYVINLIRNDPTSRRILWNLWNPKELHNMRLPPCHMQFQILINDSRHMTGIMYQRSCDFPVGVPANIQFYSAITMMLAQQTGCVPYEFVHMTADSHIYYDQIEAVKEYLELPEIPSPKLGLRKASDIYSYKPEDFVLTEFESGPKLQIPVAV